MYSLIRFRRRSDQLGDGIAIEGNLPEIFWTAVPAVVVLFVGLYSYDIYDRMGGMVPLAHDHMAGAHEQRIWGGISSGTTFTEGTAATALPIDVIAMHFVSSLPRGRHHSWRAACRRIGQSPHMEAKDVIHAFLGA